MAKQLHIDVRLKRAAQKAVEDEHLTDIVNDCCGRLNNAIDLHMSSDPHRAEAMVNGVKYLKDYVSPDGTLCQTVLDAIDQRLRADNPGLTFEVSSRTSERIVPRPICWLCVKCSEPFE